MAGAGTTGRITGRRGGRHEAEAEYDFLRLVILEELSKGKRRILFTENWIQLSRIVAWCGSQLLGWTVEQLSDNATHRVDEQTGKTLGPLFSQVSIEAGINIIGGQWRVTKAGLESRTKGSRVYWDRFSRRPSPDNQDGRQLLLASRPGHNWLQAGTL